MHDRPPADQLPSLEGPDEVSLRHRLDQVVADSMRPISMGLAVVFLVSAVVYRLAFEPPRSTVMAGFFLLAGVAYLLTWAAQRRWRLPASWAHPVALVLVTIAMSLTALELHLTMDPLQSTEVMVAVLGVGVFYLHRAWYAATVGVLLLEWGWMVTRLPTFQGWVTLSVVMFAAVIVSAVAHEYRLGTHRDLERSNVQLKRNVRHLQRSNLALEQYAHLAAHDLQEPLRDVARYIQLLDRRYSHQLDEEGRRYVGYAVDGANRLHARLRDLLRYTELDDEPPAYQRVPLGEALDRALDRLDDLARELDASVQVGDLPEVHADRAELEELLGQLLENAMRFHGSTPPAIHVDAEARDGTWVVRVQDGGEGIDPAYHERVFAPFKRLHTWEDVPGTGVGLAICRKIVDRHGGEIWIESQRGKGTVVSFTLPAAQGGPRANRS